MKLYVSVRNEYFENLSTVGLLRDNIRLYDATENYKDVGEEVLLEEVNGVEYNNIYISAKVDTNGDNIGNNPSSSDFWLVKSKANRYRALQEAPTQPTTAILTATAPTMGLGIKAFYNPTRFYVLGNLGGTSITLREYDPSTKALIGATTQVTVAGQLNYLFALVNPSLDEINLRVEVSGAIGDKVGFLVAKPCIEVDFTTDTKFCNQCPNTKKTNVVRESIFDNSGQRVEGSELIIEEQNINFTTSEAKANEIAQLGLELIDVPILILPKNDITDFDNIYGRYNSMNLTSKCNGRYTFDGTVRTFPLNKGIVSGQKEEIMKPTVWWNCDNTIHGRSARMNCSDFAYTSYRKLYHANTDWEIFYLGNVIISTYYNTIDMLSKAIRALIKGKTFEFRVRHRDRLGHVSPWSERATATVPTDAIPISVTQPFCDTSGVLLLPLTKDSKDVIHNRDWAGTVTYTTSGSFYVDKIASFGGNDRLYGDKNTIYYPLDYSSNNSEITISWLGSAMDAGSGYCFPMVVRYGSFIVALAPLASGDNKAGGLLWLESSTRKGDGSPPQAMNYDFKWEWKHLAFGINMATRTVKVYIDGLLYITFSNIPDLGTSNNFNAVYDLGVTAPCSGKKRGRMRGFHVFDRLLTSKEHIILSEYYFKQ